MSASGAERVRAYRARQREAGAADTSRGFRKDHKRIWNALNAKPERPFCGCDGEGAGTDAQGRQLYLLFRMGGRELYRGGDRLTTEELLDFICDHDPGVILAGFAFGYDTTMILRDLPASQQKRLFAPKNFGPGFSQFVWYKNFDIDYLPKQYLKVRRVRIERGTDGSERRIVIPGSTRTIWETFGFFQKSFVKVIEEFSVGSRDGRLAIAADKSRRADFVSIGQRERDYCALECEYLAELMEKLRGYCSDAGIKPRSWSGAGKLASALHSLHDTPKAAHINSSLPAGLLDYANMGYYGGRFEITRTGKIEGKVYEYDIRSAYPDAMRRLPCLEHGEWEEADKAAIRFFAANVGGRYGADPLFIAGCTFKTPSQDGGFSQLGGLPVRSKEGHLYWPRTGGGIYWAPEIRSAEKLGAKCSLGTGWIYRPRCECKPFEWVETLYEYRKSIGGSGPGYPIKLGINSLYGKLAQRKGNGVYNNMIWAGLITAMTRAKLNDAIALNPGRIVMVATDAVYSLDPIPALDCGDRLGDWEGVELDGLFIVQPGLYWCPAKRKRKSRGLSGKFFEEPGRTESFEDAWESFRCDPPEYVAHKYNAINEVISVGGLRVVLKDGKAKNETADIVRMFGGLKGKGFKKALKLGLFTFDTLQGLTPDYMREHFAQEGENWFLETQSQGEDLEDMFAVFDLIAGWVTDGAKMDKIPLDLINLSVKYDPQLESVFPHVPVPVPGFIGMKLAISRNKPELAGTWVHDTREISFDYRNKRQGHRWEGGCIVTAIKAGYPGLVSLPHKDFLKAGGQEPWELARLMLDEQPDFVDFGIPFKD